MLRNKMTIDQISRTTLKAYQKHCPVSLTKANAPMAITGTIEGYLDDGTIVIADNLIDMNKITCIKIE